MFEIAGLWSYFPLLLLLLLVVVVVVVVAVVAVVAAVHCQQLFAFKTVMLPGIKGTNLCAELSACQPAAHDRHHFARTYILNPQSDPT